MAQDAKPAGAAPDGAVESTLDRIIEERRSKGRKLAELGSAPYRNDLRPTHTLGQVREAYEATKPAPAAAPAVGDAPAAKKSDGITPIDGKQVLVAGRLIARRGFGKTVFAPIRDATGDIQLYLSVEHLAASDFEQILPQLDVGDFVAAQGTVFWTKRGEMSVLAERLYVVTKSLRPLPDKWHGLTDIDLRYRQRYVDLAVSPDVREVFVKRSRIVRGIREFFDARGFLEVETPMMHPIVGGAAARPFETHHNALDMQLYMRIAPELYLKRLLVGGLDRVYEVNRNFRNEGLSRRHNPEFTMLEFYWAYHNVNDLMDLTEELVAGLARSVCGTTDLVWEGTPISLGGPWARVTVRQAVAQHAGLSADDAAALFEDPVRAVELALKCGVAAGAVVDALMHRLPAEVAHRPALVTAIKGFADAAARPGIVAQIVASYGAAEDARIVAGHLGFLVFEAKAEQHLVQPTFLTEFPLAVSPLARRNEADPAFCDRFELFVCGKEIANGFSELNDPDDQRARFTAQIAAKAAGAGETMDYDHDYCNALEVGMPPAAGEGIGIDRLVMMLTDQASIRDVILFPLMRPE